MSNSAIIDDIPFLKEQVQRLNAVLAEYQRKYPPIGLTPDTCKGTDLPWLSDKNLMSPLLMEYDANMQVMQGQLNKYQAEQRNLRLQVDKLVAENNRLTKEMKELVESQLTSGPSIAPTGMGTDIEVDGEDRLLHNMQDQLQMALKEKDSLMEMWQASVSEVDRLEAQVRDQQFNPRLHGLEHQANQIKEQYIRTVAELNSEIQTLQQELQIAKQELKISQNQTTELRKTLEELRKQLTLQEQEINVAQDGKHQMHGQSIVYKKKSVALETQFQETQNELAQCKLDSANLEKRLENVQKKAEEMEQMAYEAGLKVRENQQTMESAILEKDQAVMREKLAVQEISRLQEALSSLVDEAGARTRQEVDSVRQQCNQNIGNLTEQIHQLELDLSERQTQLDRAMREKRSAESELENVYREGMIANHKEHSSYDDLNRRACDAERLRDETIVKMDAIQNQMKRMEMSLKQEKKHLEAEVSSLSDRLVMLNQEFDMANKDRIQLTEKIDELQRKLVKRQQERDSANRNYTKEVTCLEKARKLKENEYKVSLKATEDLHRDAMMDLRQMLDSQLRMSSKWKEECQTITSKFESKLRDLRDQVKREKQRNSELSRLYQDSKNKSIEQFA